MIMIIYVSCEYVGGFGDDGDYKYQFCYRNVIQGMKCLC